MIDPRADSAEKIKPPAPLPFVSRKALKRVKDYMAPPTECRYCGSPVNIITHDQLYGRTYSNWPYLYQCSCCDSYVGMHPETDLPLGTLADKLLRESRKVAKNMFTLLLKLTMTSRNDGYTWLAARMAIDKSICHFGWFEPEQCAQVLRICRDALAKAPNVETKTDINKL